MRKGVLLIFTYVFICLLVTGISLARDVSPLCEKYGIKGSDLERIRHIYMKSVDAGIPDEELYDFFSDIVSYGLTCTQLESVLEKTLVLKKRGLPYKPVFGKVREGIAKGVPPGMIVAVAGEKASVMEKASVVITRLEEEGMEVRDFESALLLVSTYIEKGYSPDEIVEKVTREGVEYAGFAGLGAFVGQGK